MYNGNLDVRSTRLELARKAAWGRGDLRRHDAISKVQKKLKLAAAVRRAQSKLTVLEYNALAMYLRDMWQEDLFNTPSAVAEREHAEPLRVR